MQQKSSLTNSQSSKKNKKVKKVSLLPPLTRSYEKKDYENLCENEYYRFLPNAKKIGAILLHGDEARESVQFSASDLNSQNSSIPEIRPMRNIKKINPLGLTRYEATSPTGTTFYAKRFMQYKFNNNEVAHVAFFSPMQRNVFWGNIDDTPLFDASKVREGDLPYRKKSKAGDSLTVKREDIPKREQINRNPSQNGVMGHSALDELNGFFKQNENKLTQSIVARIRRSVQAPLYNPFFSNYRPEWLHAYGWGLTPIKKNAQISNNLGSAPKWSNTEMMLLERIAKWFSLNKKESKVSIKPKFTMLLDTDVIKHIDFSVKIKWNKNKIKLSQSLDPFVQYPIFRKASDIAIATFLFDKLMDNQKGYNCTIAQPKYQPAASLTALHPKRAMLGEQTRKRKREEAKL